jgi:hypothetical protein
MAVELAFLDHALEGFIRALDAVLVIFAVGGQKPHDAIAVIRSHVADRPGSEIDGLSDLKLVRFQRRSPELEYTDQPAAGCRKASLNFQSFEQYSSESIGRRKKVHLPPH